ncbi:hypothetical protein IWX76_002643 [Pedobacter sp. CAN_A7]|uniref:DUF4397 domain-containing protein n=1 Tax=Pedobacter sp. CAN_A7 TaxID=2787722 RepID=UPI0018CBA3CE
MKNKSLLKNVLAGLSILALTTGLTSCKKDDVDESGTTHVKVVNASQSSNAQGFFLANTPLVANGLAFGTASDYIASPSGNNLTAEFKNDGSTTPYATDNFDFDSGTRYSVFLAGDGQSARIKVFTDDLAAPASGQAKVRFIHLSDAAPGNIDIRRGNGNNLVVNLSRDNASDFTAVAPGILELNVYASGQTTSLGTFNLAAFAPDKIYTVFVTGNSASTIKVNQVTHN